MLIPRFLRHYSYKIAVLASVLPIFFAIAAYAESATPTALPNAPTENPTKSNPQEPEKISNPAISADGRIRKAVLVIPIARDLSGQKLWQDDNKWRNAWYEAALESGGGLVVVPLGDLSDRVDIDDTNYENATYLTLSRMYERYGIGEIHIITAFFNQKADPKPTLEVGIKKLLQDKNDLSSMNFTIHSTENIDKLMSRAANEIAKHIYTQQTIDRSKIEFERVKEINARMNVSDIREWEELRKRLLTHGNIVSIKLNSISFYETTMTISYKGTSDMLGKTLVTAGLRVLQDGDSFVLTLK